jgi:type IV pilus assembly protein PilA
MTARDEKSQEVAQVAFALLLLLGLAAGVGWGFSRWQARRPCFRCPSAVKSDLKALYVTQKSYLQEKDRYSADFASIGFAPERRNRYAYFSVPVGPVQRRDRPELEEQGPYSIIAADRHAFPKYPVPNSFYMTGCPLTPALDKTGKRLGLGVWGDSGDMIFVAAAAGNLDEDSQLDCWSVASVDRVSATGEKIDAGQPHCEASDL